MATQRGVHQQARDEARQPGHRTELAVGIQVAAGAQLHAGQVTPFGRIVEIQHHHPAQQPVAEALLARKAAVRHRHQRVVVGQHVDPGEVHVRLARGHMLFQGLHRLDRQAGRAQDLEIVELQVLIGIAHGMEDAFREAPDGPASPLRLGHEAHVGLVHREIGRLAEVVVHHHRVGGKRARQLGHRLGTVDGRHHDKNDLGFHGCCKNCSMRFIGIAARIRLPVQPSCPVIMFASSGVSPTSGLCYRPAGRGAEIVPGGNGPETEFAIDHDWASRIVREKCRQYVDFVGVHPKNPQNVRQERYVVILQRLRRRPEGRSDGRATAGAGTALPVGRAHTTALRNPGGPYRMAAS